MYLNQCWLRSNKVQRYLHDSIVAASARANILYNELENYTYNSLRPSDAYMRRWTNHHCFR